VVYVLYKFLYNAILLLSLDSGCDFLLPLEFSHIFVYPCIYLISMLTE